MSLKDWIKGRVATMDASARPWANRSLVNGWAYEFLLFGLKQAWASLFGGAMLILLVGTHMLWPAHAWLARYDFLVVAAVALQVFMLALYGIQVNGHARLRISRRYGKSQLADFRLVLTLALRLLARTRLRAKRRMVAMLFAPW
jgi:hypothetical protein